MLRKITHLKGFTVHASDGVVGTAEQLYFEDQTWTIRYLAVDSSRWLERRTVVISPSCITQINWAARRIDVSLTRDQLKNSPDIEAHWPSQSKEAHLRSLGGIDGYDVHALDGEIGFVSGFMLEQETWAIRYIEVATRNWWPGKKLLVAPGWIQRANWLGLKLHVGLTRLAIQTAAAYVDSASITREYESQLHTHFGQPPYWLNQPKSSQDSLAAVPTMA